MLEEMSHIFEALVGNLVQCPWRLLATLHQQTPADSEMLEVFPLGGFSWNFKHLFGILLVQCSCWVTSMVKCLLVLLITSYHPPVCFQNLHLALNLGLRDRSRMERVQVSWSGFKAIFVFSGVKTLRKSISCSSACNRKQLSWVQDF